MGAFALCALVGQCSTPAPPGATQAAVADMLGHAMVGVVRPDDFVWEPSHGDWYDALIGREVLFLGLSADEENRDLFRARVRVSREGKPLRVSLFRNLTMTPLGDESDLTAHGRWIGFVSNALGAVQGVTVLDLDGAALPQSGRWGKTKARIDQFLSTGTFGGLGRQDIAFQKPPSGVLLEFQGDRLVMALDDPATPAALDLVPTALHTGPQNPFQAWAWKTPPRDKPTPHFVMDGMRSVFGTYAADVAKSVLFDARSRWVVFAEGGADSEPSSTPVPAFVARDGSWPPTPLAVQFGNPQDGEGQWKRPPVNWLPKAPNMVGEPDPYLMETFIRPDPALPFATVTLVAMDTRQVSLRIEAGFSEPRPLTGPAGRGRVPKADRGKLVAAFNGAFQTRHGEYGMVVDGRVLLPPKAHASSVAVDGQGRAFVGTWGTATALPPQLMSLRQNLDPLIEDGVINPRERTQWGFPLEGGNYLTERSAICRTSDGYLIYGYGIELDAITLARALHLAGCVDAMHLDMNPGHVGFAYHNAQGEALKSQLVRPEMSIATDRFVKASAKDFFYLVLSDPKPQIGALDWKPDGGAQPPPAWLPAVHTSTMEKLGTNVSLFAIDVRRFHWRIVPGEDERTARTAENTLDPATVARAMTAIGLGVAFRKDNRRGLVIDGVEKLPLRSDLGMLSTDLQGALSISIAVEPMALPGDATELVVLAEQQKVRDEARKLSTHRLRAAACRLDGTTMIIAQATSDNSEPMTRALIALGCNRVVGLNRGVQVRAFVHRASTSNAPQASYPDTALYGMAKSAGGTALRLTAGVFTPATEPAERTQDKTNNDGEEKTPAAAP